MNNYSLLLRVKRVFLNLQKMRYQICLEYQRAYAKAGDKNVKIKINSAGSRFVTAEVAADSTERT